MSNIVRSSIRRAALSFAPKILARSFTFQSINSIKFSVTPIKSAVSPIVVKRNFAGGLQWNETLQRVLTVVKQFGKIDAAITIQGDSHFTNDLGLDSLDLVELSMAFEDEFSIEIPDSESERILTPNDAAKYIITHPQAK